MTENKVSNQPLLEKEFTDKLKRTLVDSLFNALSAILRTMGEAMIRK